MTVLREERGARCKEKKEKEKKERERERETRRARERRTSYVIVKDRGGDR